MIPRGHFSPPFKCVKTVLDLFPGWSSKRSLPAGMLIPFQRARGSATRPDPGDPWEFASAGLTEVDVSQVPRVEEEVSAEEVTKPSLARPEGERGVDVRRTQPVGLCSQGIACTSSFKCKTFTTYSHLRAASSTKHSHLTLTFEQLQAQNIHTLLSPSSSFKHKTFTPYSHLRAASSIKRSHLTLTFTSLQFKAMCVC